MAHEYLFIFGYETPEERKSNSALGTDYESSMFVRIMADSAAEAENWGRRIADGYVQGLYPGEIVQWSKLGFASGIEEDPDELTLRRWSEIPVVKVGEYLKD